MTFQVWVAREILRAGSPEILAELVGVATTTVRRSWGDVFPTASHVATLSEVTGKNELEIAALVHAARRSPEMVRPALALSVLRRRPTVLHFRAS